jgi:peroxiredoxin
MQLHRSKAQFENNGFQVVLVGLGTFDQAEAFKKQFSLSFPIICDPEKKLYRAYGLGRGSVVSMASPALLLKGLKTLSRGHIPGVPQGDVMQMPGVFLIDTYGNIRYAHYSKDPSDNPSIETLLALKDIFKEKVSQAGKKYR